MQAWGWAPRAQGLGFRVGAACRPGGMHPGLIVGWRVEGLHAGMGLGTQVSGIGV